MTSYTGTSGDDTYVTTTPPTGGDVYDGGDGTNTLVAAAVVTVSAGPLAGSSYSWLQVANLTNF